MIYIHPSKNADTRTSDAQVTKEQLLQDTMSHIRDVEKGMHFLAEKIEKTGRLHDYTKILYIDEFYNDFSSIKSGEKTDFKAMNWYKNRHLIERHHLNDRVPSDVDLVDVIEMIVDCTMAGLARSGSVSEITISTEVLEKAFKNTAKILARNIKVIEDEQEEI